MTRLSIKNEILVAVCLLAVIFVVSFVLASERSGEWRGVCNAYITAHPICERCGKPATQIHHIHPVHAYRELELDQTNLIALCDDCHIREAHLGNYQAWNPLIVEEAKLHRAMVAARPRTKAESEAFVRRFRKGFDEATYQNAP